MNRLEKSNPNTNIKKIQMILTTVSSTHKTFIQVPVLMGCVSASIKGDGQLYPHSSNKSQVPDAGWRIRSTHHGISPSRAWSACTPCMYSTCVQYAHVLVPSSYPSISYAEYLSDIRHLRRGRVRVLMTDPAIILE